MEDWILGLLLIIILIIFLYINNTQHIYRHNDKLLNNDKTNNTNLNNKLSNNVSNNNLVSNSINNSINNSSYEKFTSHDDGTYINIYTIANNTPIYLKDSDTKFKFQLISGKPEIFNNGNELEFIFDGDLKTDYKEFSNKQKMRDNLTDNLNKLEIIKVNDITFTIKFETELTPNTFYNLTVKKDGILIPDLTKTFTVGDKRFNYFSSLIIPTNTTTEKDKNLNLRLESKKKNDENRILDLTQPNINDNCLERLDKFKNNDSTININYFYELDLEQFNLISFKMTIPNYDKFNDYYSNEFEENIITEIEDPNTLDKTLNINKNNLLNDLNNFIPDRFETELLILDNDDYCPINFNDNKYVKPTIEKINVNQSQKNYLLKFKFIKDKFYNRKVIYIAKITLVYTNLITLGEKRYTKDGGEVDVGIERNSVPYYLAFTVNNIETNDVLIKDLNFLEELNKQNQVNQMFQNSQKLQDNTIDNLEKDVNNVSKDAYLFM